MCLGQWGDTVKYYKLVNYNWTREVVWIKCAYLINRKMISVDNKIMLILMTEAGNIQILS